MPCLSSQPRAQRKWFAPGLISVGLLASVGCGFSFRPASVPDPSPTGGARIEAVELTADEAASESAPGRDGSSE